MKVINTVGVVREPFDVASGFAEILFALHVAEKYAPPVLRKKADTEWTAVPSERNDLGGKNPPCITAKCNCGQHSHFEGPDPYTSAELRHIAACDGATEIVPSMVAEAYLRDRAEFYANARKPAAEDVLQKLRNDLKAGLVRVL